MQLKRGLPRESCDFCHRRKIKCDRSLRAKEGLTSCSQCALRRGPCQLNDATETRTRRRDRGRVRGSGTGIYSGDGELSQTGQTGLLSGDNQATTSIASASPFELIPAQAHDQSTLIDNPDNMFSGDFLGLNSDNILFLDHIFMDDDKGSTEWMDAQQTQYPADIPTETLGLDSAVTSSDSTLTAALHCYFKFAAPWLPILLEDAFWEDYRSGKCSHALISAMACRGMPFTELLNTEKWILQQQYASDFREAFLESRNIASNDGTIRLDDLEALALMVNFEYEDSNTPPIYSNLGKLFLKHESLVLMTLQLQVQDRVSTSSGSTVYLARARERRILLYWHVYGLDAFHCLDLKQVSLIPDRNIIENDDLPPHNAKDFLDAIFGLAVIARKILQRLCNNSAKRHGIDPHNLHDLYAQIHQWRDNCCPPHLRRYESSPGILATQDNHEDRHNGPPKYIQLRRAVLWTLEINCLMQIECCVTDFGIRDCDYLQKEITTARVRYESLQALRDNLSICRWVDLHSICDEDGIQHSLVDLAPLALRNVSAGLCFWTCQNGIKESRNLISRDEGPEGRESHGLLQRNLMDEQLENAKLLRDTAAKAISHKDTANVLECLDKQIVLFEEALRNPLRDE
ncbi:hypothetical protein PENSTE_c002G05505 [Penicillium steckii]|uniref:Zn(2)-C6 fungal-type domain-containing protein n=1 Tax=Penicillium steckii TaxID=303698 RepID=A0A1V6TW51_9EURO|nr:hypothetical protein PENSTE_c002G05505 [Penicillium steckii]